VATAASSPGTVRGAPTDREIHPTGHRHRLVEKASLPHARGPFDEDNRARSAAHPIERCTQLRNRAIPATKDMTTSH
jgi:hypothetical protein